MKVSRSLYCFTTSISHGVEKYFPRLLGISDAIFSLCYIGYIETCYNFEIQVKGYLTLFIVSVKISWDNLTRNLAKLETFSDSGL